MSSKHRHCHTKSQKKRKFSNFLAKYPNSEKLTADNFAKIWEHYDSNSKSNLFSAVSMFAYLYLIYDDVGSFDFNHLDIFILFGIL